MAKRKVRPEYTAYVKKHGISRGLPQAYDDDDPIYKDPNVVAIADKVLKYLDSYEQDSDTGAEARRELHRANTLKHNVDYALQDLQDLRTAEARKQRYAERHKLPIEQVPYWEDIEAEGEEDDEDISELWDWAEPDAPPVKHRQLLEEIEDAVRLAKENQVPKEGAVTSDANAKNIELTDDEKAVNAALAAQRRW